MIWALRERRDMKERASGSATKKLMLRHHMGAVESMTGVTSLISLTCVLSHYLENATQFLSLFLCSLSNFTTRYSQARVLDCTACISSVCILYWWIDSDRIIPEKKKEKMLGSERAIMMCYSQARVLLSFFVAQPLPLIQYSFLIGPLSLSVSLPLSLNIKSILHPLQFILL